MDMPDFLKDLFGELKCVYQHHLGTCNNNIVPIKTKSKYNLYFYIP